MFLCDEIRFRDRVSTACVTFSTSDRETDVRVWRVMTTLGTVFFELFGKQEEVCVGVSRSIQTHSRDESRGVREGVCMGINRQVKQQVQPNACLASRIRGWEVQTQARLAFTF